MNLHELPMIIFTVIAQMCVGMFIVLGILQLVASVRHDRQTVERLTEPAVYVIGPAMVVGLAASTLHMHDVTNVLNVFRHVDSSWLSREIVFGMAFAGLGFAFALTQWFKVGTIRQRQLLAGATALAGIGLVWSMAQIYYILTTVPAWHTPIVPFHFFATALMLGALATGAALMGTTMVRRRAARRAAADATTSGGSRPSTEQDNSGARNGRGAALATVVRTRVTEINRPTTDSEWHLTTRTVQLLALGTIVVGAAVLISYPLHIADLGTDPVGAVSAQVFSGGFFIARLVLLTVASGVLAVFTYRTASDAAQEHPHLLTGLITAAFVLAFASEMMGRSLHYDSMIRIGI